MRGFAIIIIVVIVLSGFIYGGATFLSSENKEDDKGSTSKDVKGASSQVRRVTVTDFISDINKADSVLIDIRTPEEYNSGHIKGSVNIDYYDKNFQSELSKLDKGKHYNIYCNSGNRSSDTLKIMKNLGFEKVSELQGGIQSWTLSKQPVCIDC